MLPPSIELQPGETEVFRETQRLWQNEIIRVLMPMEFVVITGIMAAVGTTVPQDQQVYYWLVWLGAAVVLPAGLMAMGFVTVVTDRRVIVRWFPPVPGREVMLADVTLAEAVRYSPLGDAGGWGWRFSRKFHRVMNISGDRGVHLRWGAGKGDQVLIGSKRAEELAAALRA